MNHISDQNMEHFFCGKEEKTVLVNLFSRAE
jgi:hypothetical protein